jgi:hypothetical protein
MRFKEYSSHTTHNTIEAGRFSFMKKEEWQRITTTNYHGQKIDCLGY